MIQNNSQKVQPGDTFVVIPNLKDREYLNEALDKGAIHIVGLSTLKDFIPSHVQFTAVENPRAYLAQALTQQRNDKQPRYCVAVTGTNGKTSVVHYLFEIWKRMDVRAGRLGTNGLAVNDKEASSSLTTPDPILFNQILQDIPADYFAFEASSHGLDQHRIDGVKLSAVGFTNLTQDHLDYHHTMENYFLAKRRLFTELADKETLKVIYKGDPYGRRLLAENLPNTVSYDAIPKVNNLKIFGSAQIQNLNAAILLSGFSFDSIKDILPELEAPIGRFQFVGYSKMMAKVFVDYAHTPHALENVLKTARELTSRKVIVVFGCGGDRDKTKRPLMGRIASNLADIVFVTDDNPRFENPELIRFDILKGAEHAFEISPREEAIFRAVQMAQEDDIVVIAGKGHEEYQDCQGIRYKLSDKTVALDALNY